MIMIFSIPSTAWANFCVCLYHHRLARLINDPLLLAAAELHYHRGERVVEKRVFDSGALVYHIALSFLNIAHHLEYSSWRMSTLNSRETENATYKPQQESAVYRKEDERLLRQLLNKVKASADAVDVHEAESSKSVELAALKVRRSALYYSDTTSVSCIIFTNLGQMQQLPMNLPGV